MLLNQIFWTTYLGINNEQFFWNMSLNQINRPFFGPHTCELSICRWASWFTWASVYLVPAFFIASSISSLCLSNRNILIFIWPLNLKFQPLRQNIQCSCVISRYWYSCIYQWKMKEMKFNFLFKQMEKSMKNIQCSAYEYNISTGNSLQTWLSILNCLDFQIYGRLSKSFILALRWIRCILWIVILKNDDKGRLWPCMN